MRLLLIALLFLAAVVGLSLVAQKDPGYVYLTYNGWAVESSVTLLIAVLFLGFGATYVLLRLLFSGWEMPRKLLHWRKTRRSLRARRYTQRGLIALAEGNWKRAERLLVRHVDDYEMPLINFLGAARAAGKLNANDRRDEYLSRALKSTPEAELAVGLTQAEVQVAQGQVELALASLNHLRSIAPKHGYVLHLLKRIYERLGSWEELLAILPDLKKHGEMDLERYEETERAVLAHLLQEAAGKNDVAALKAVWEQVPRERRSGKLLEICAKELVRLREFENAEALIRDALRFEWSPTLVRLYGRLELPNPERPLAAAEGWLRNHEKSAELLLTLGRLAMRCQLWGKARAYLEASIGSEPMPETYCELARLLTYMEEPELAADYHKKGLELAAGGTCLAPV